MGYLGGELKKLPRVPSSHENILHASEHHKYLACWASSCFHTEKRVIIVYCFSWLQCATQYCTLPNGNLLIVRLVESNAGEYTCVAKNTLGEARSSAYLTVIPALELTLKPVNRVVYQNSTVLLPCRARSSSVLDVNYAWFFEVSLVNHVDNLCSD